jgi:hypothetical protein
MRAEMLVNYLILGEDRKAGEILDDDVLAQIDAGPLRALESQEIIRILTTDNETMAELVERLDKLEAAVFAPPTEG